MRHVLLAALLLLPAAASAQTAPSSQANLAGSLASSLSTALEENDHLKAQVADLQKKLAAAAQAAPASKEGPK